jgi:hypothetical protein
MSNSCRLLNYIDVDGEYLKFYTELDSNFIVGEKVFIVGGNFDNTVYTDKNSKYYDIFNEYASGYEVIAVDNTVLSNAVTLNIKYTDTKFTSGGVESYIFDPKPVYKTEEELILNPNQLREAYISKSYFKQGEFNGGKFKDGLFGVYNIKGLSSNTPKEYQRQKFVDNYKAKLVAVMESIEATSIEKEEAESKYAIINTIDYTIFEEPSVGNKAIFNNVVSNKPAEWVGGVFIGGEFQWGNISAKYANNRVGKKQSLNDKLEIKSLSDNSKYDIKVFRDNNEGIGYTQFISGNIGKPGTEHMVNFKSGKILSAHWFQGVFENGLFDGGYWYNGDFKSGRIRSNYQLANWYNGTFGIKTKNNAFAEDLRWYDGTWINGTWRGASNVAIERIYYGNDTIHIEVKANKKQLFVVGQDVLISYIKNSLTNLYLDNYTDSPNNKLLNFQTFKLIDITESDDNVATNRATLVLEGTSDVNLSNINLQHAKVSQSFFHKGVWMNGVWESGLRKPTTYEVTSLVSDSVIYEGVSKTEITLFFDKQHDIKVGDIINVSNLTAIQEVTLSDGSINKVGTSLNEPMQVNEVEWIYDMYIKVHIDLSYNSVAIRTESDLSVQTPTLVSKAFWNGGIFRSGVWEGGSLRETWDEVSTIVNGIPTTTLVKIPSIFSNHLYFDTQNKQIQSVWKSGYWFSGTWENGAFLSGVWENGTWENGYMTSLDDATIWLNGTWKNGTLNRGIWNRGKMINGTVINPSIRNIDWVEGTYTNGFNLYDSTTNTNRSGRNIGEKYDSISAPSVVYIDTNGWVQLDQPSHYQKGYNVIFKDLESSPNPYNDEMFTVSDTQNYGTKIQIINHSELTYDNPLARTNTLPVISIGEIAGLCVLAEDTSSHIILIGDKLHNRIIQVDLKSGIVDMYGKVIGGTGNLDITILNLKKMCSNPFKTKVISTDTNYKIFERSTNIYVADGSEVKAIVVKETISENILTLEQTLISKETTTHVLKPNLTIAEDVLDMWVSNDDTVFLITNLGNVHYWSKDIAFTSLNVVSTIGFTINNFIGVRSDSGTVHLIINGTIGATKPQLKHVVLNYSNAIDEYVVSTQVDVNHPVYQSINNVAVKLEANAIKMWILTSEEVYQFNYGKYFTSNPNDDISILTGAANSIKHLYYNNNGYLNIVNNFLDKINIGKMPLTSVVTTTLLKGYKVSTNSNNKELSPYVTARVLYRTKISKKVSFNKNGSVYSAHLVSSTWDNGLFVGSWDVPTYLNHNALSKNTIFINGEFNGDFKNGYFLGGNVTSNNESNFKQGHILSDFKNVEWYGKITSKYRYDINNVNITGDSINVNIQALTKDITGYKIVPVSEIAKKSDIQIPAIFRTNELEIFSARNSGMNINGYDEVELKVELPSVYEHEEWDLSGLWNNKEIFISTSEHIQYLFGYQYVTDSFVRDGYLYLTIRSDLKMLNGIYEFKNKPKVLTGKFLKINDITVNNDTTSSLVLSLPLPALGSVDLAKFIKKFYLLDNIEILANGNLIIPGYSQVFNTSINRTFNPIIVNTASLIENIYIDNVIDDSYVRVNLSISGGAGKIIASNITVSNSFITSNNINDSVDSSVFLSGKTDRNWNNGVWLNLDKKGLPNGKSQFGTPDVLSVPTKQVPVFNGKPLRIISVRIENNLILLRVSATDLATLPKNAQHSYITIRGLKGNNSAIFGAAKSKVFRIQDIDTNNNNIIVNPLMTLPNSSADIIDKQNIFLKNIPLETATNTLGVETSDTMELFEYAYASVSCWNGGDFYGDFKSIWNAGNFMGGKFTSTAKWFGAFDTDSFTGSYNVTLSEVDKKYQLRIKLDDTTLQAGDFIYVKFNPIFVDGEYINLYESFYSTVIQDDTGKYTVNKSTTFLKHTKPTYDVQILRYRTDYYGNNNMVVNVSSAISKPYTLETKQYDIPRVSFFYNGVFENPIWHNGIFVGGKMLTLAEGKVVWINGIKHNGHLGGDKSVKLPNHIHWLGGFHESVNNALLSSTRNMIWYRGIWNGGAWLSGHWHSLTNTLTEVNRYNINWSIWEKGEFYSKGRNVTVTVAGNNIPNTLKAGDVVDGTTLKVNDLVFVLSGGNTTNLYKGIYKVVERGYIQEVYDVTHFTVSVNSGLLNNNKIYDYNNNELLNAGGKTTNHPNYNESIWHGGIWKNTYQNIRSYTSNTSKVYNIKAGITAEYDAVNSIWLGGVWLRGIWEGGIFANGYWHSVTETPITTSPYIYEQEIGYIYNVNASEWRTGKMLNSIWNGGIVKDMGSVLDTVFGDVHGYDGFYKDDFEFSGDISQFVFKKSNTYMENILGTSVLSKSKLSNPESKIHQAKDDGIMPVYWNRGIWGNGIMQFSYWRNLTINNIENKTITKTETENASIFRNGCMYSSYWEGGLMKAAASANQITSANRKLNGTSPFTIFYKSQWEKGYWQSVSSIPSNTTTVDDKTPITDALFIKSVWSAGIFEGGIFDLSVWRSGTISSGVKVIYSNNSEITLAMSSGEMNPLFALSNVDLNEINTDTDKTGLVKASTLFTTLAKMRYIGSVDNFASVWVNGTMRGSVWHGGIWQKGIFKHKSYSNSSKLNFFDMPNANNDSIGVWTRGIWLAGYFSYFNDESLKTVYGNEHLDRKNGQRCVFMGMNATSINNNLYNDTSIFGVNTVSESLLNNKASVFGRRMFRVNNGSDTRFFSIFNGTFINGTFLDDVSSDNKANKLIISPFAVVGETGYDFTNRTIKNITTVNYKDNQMLSDIVSKKVSISTTTTYTIPFTSTGVMYLNSGTIIADSGEFLGSAFNGAFHSTSTTNNGIWRHDHAIVGDGHNVSSTTKSVLQGSALLYHVSDNYGGEPNYVETATIQPN